MKKYLIVIVGASVVLYCVYGTMGGGSVDNTEPVINLSPLIQMPIVNQTITHNQTIRSWKVVNDSIDLSPESIQKYAKNISFEIITAHNEKYNKSLIAPAINFENVAFPRYVVGAGICLTNASSYRQESLYSLKKDLKHELCHYILHKTCATAGDTRYSLSVGEESFCDVYANVNNTISNCIASHNNKMYCEPFVRDDLKDRQGFIDCVFNEACSDGAATSTDLMNCYEEWKK